MSTKRKRSVRDLAFWSALRERYPFASRWELLRPACSVLLANALTAKALVRGEMKPWELVVLVGLEAIAFSAISWAQLRFVPTDAHPEDDRPKSIAQRLGAMAFGFVWLAFVYGLVFGAFLRELPPYAEALREPWHFLSTSALRWPLAVSVAGALLDAVADWRFWKRRGGTFISTPGFTAIARWLTLFLGGIPFFVPFAAGAVGIAQVAKGFEKRFRSPTRRMRNVALVAIPLLMIGLFAGMGWLIRAGALGWTIGYCAAKFASELLILGAPLVAQEADGGGRPRAGAA